MSVDRRDGRYMDAATRSRGLLPDLEPRVYFVTFLMAYEFGLVRPFLCILIASWNCTATPCVIS
jgi:hypothetical protein